MRRGGRLIMILGVILALVAFVGVLYMMRTTQKGPAAPAEVETRSVVVAAANIPARAKISSADVKLKEVPVSVVPPLAATDVMSVTGRFALSDIYAEQIILRSMLAEPGKTAGDVPSLGIPQGMVAIAVPVNEISGVAEALRAGDRVDVIVSLNVLEYDQEGNESKPEYSAQFTVQDVEVMHVGKWSVPPATAVTEEESRGGFVQSPSTRPGSAAVEEVSVVILLVEPQDALVLKYAIDRNEEEKREAFTLVLRGPEDRERYTTEAVNQEYMLRRFKFSRPPFIIQEKGE